jgi:hypothetical protein
MVTMIPSPHRPAAGQHKEGEPDMTTSKTPVTADDVTEHILELLNSSEAKAGPALAALVDAMLSVLASIKCPECREIAANSVRELFPHMLAEASKAPSERSHVH